MRLVTEGSTTESPQALPPPALVLCSVPSDDQVRFEFDEASGLYINLGECLYLLSLQLLHRMDLWGVYQFCGMWHMTQTCVEFST